MPVTVTATDEAAAWGAALCAGAGVGLFASPRRPARLRAVAPLSADPPAAPPTTTRYGLHRRIAGHGPALARIEPCRSRIP